MESSPAMADLGPQGPQQQGGGGVPRWVYYLGALLLLNALSYFFHWGWILY
jgi:hypothetical protein